MADRYMAYVGSYSYSGRAKGITVFDVNVEDGSFTYRCEEQVDNSSYLCVSHSGKTLYSIADEGVVSFRILPNGGLTRLNSVNIRGMRGRHISTDAKDKYIFVSGYHDGKETVLRLNPDGTVGEITEGIYHKGLGSVSERTFRPHVSCGMRTPDERFVMVADIGLDQVKIYRMHPEHGTLQLVDAIRCDLESGPKEFLFSPDGKFLYLLYEVKNVIDVYSYESGARVPEIEKLQTLPTTDPKHSSNQTAACSLRMSPTSRYLYCSNAGDNSVSVYRRDEETGLLTQLCCLPIAGDYPKDVQVFPDERTIVCMNHASNSLSFFRVDYEKGLLVMCHRSIPINEPNCCVFAKIPKN